MSKTDKKLSKEMKAIHEKYRTKDEQELETMKGKMLLKIVDCAMRIMFMILKQKRESMYAHAFEGLAKYKRFIRKEFDEGLMIMLSEIVMNENKKHKIYGSLCIIELYGDKDFEFRQVLNALYDLYTPLKYTYTAKEITDTNKMLELLFLTKKQLQKDVHTFLQRLMQFCLLHTNAELQKIIARMILQYKIDKYDLDVICNGVYNPEEIDTKIVSTHPLFVAYTFDFLAKK